MGQIVEILTLWQPLIILWRLIAWACSAYLLILGALTFISPNTVHRFFGELASTWSANFLEAILRFMIGLAFLAVSPETKTPSVFFWSGAVLALTAIPIMFLYKFHKAQATWIIPLTKRFLPVMGVVALALGVLIAWALVR